MEYRRRNPGEAKHEQERGCPAPGGRLLHGATVADVIGSAARLFACESGFSALALQKPSALAEGETLQLRGPDIAVSHGAHCVAWRVSGGGRFFIR